MYWEVNFLIILNDKNFNKKSIATKAVTPIIMELIITKQELLEKLQTEALNKFIKYYYDEKNTRGILCACCGYGKSYLMYKIIKECVINYFSIKIY